MFEFLKKLLRPKPPSGLICPHCEKEMDEGHSIEGCEDKRLSRRWFLGALGGSAAALVIVPALPALVETIIEVPAPIIEIPAAVAGGNTYLTLSMVTHEMIAVLHNNMVAGRKVTRTWERQFGMNSHKIGDTISIRTLPRFTQRSS